MSIVIVICIMRDECFMVKGDMSGYSLMHNFTSKEQYCIFCCSVLLIHTVLLILQCGVMQFSRLWPLSTRAGTSLVLNCKCVV